MISGLVAVKEARRIISTINSANNKDESTRKTIQEELNKFFEECCNPYLPTVCNLAELARANKYSIAAPLNV